MDNQPLGAKRDEFVSRQTAIVAQLAGFGQAGRNVLGPEHRRKWQILSRQLRFQAWIPSAVRRASGSILLLHLGILISWQRGMYLWMTSNGVERAFRSGNDRALGQNVEIVLSCLAIPLSGGEPDMLGWRGWRE